MKKIIFVLIALLIIIFTYFPLNNFIKKRIYPVPADASIKMIDDSIIINTNYSNKDAKGLYVRKGETLIVLFHGSASTVNKLRNIAKIFIKENYSVLLVEYPGYGILSHYSPNEKDIYNSSAALINKHIDENKYKEILLLGHSLGAAIAIEMSKRGIGSKLIIISGFTSMDNMIALSYPKMIGTIFNTEKYNNIEKVKNISAETLIIHGEEDKIVPFNMSELLYKNMHNAERLPIKNASHDIFDILDKMNDKHWKTVMHFVRKES